MARSEGRLTQAQHMLRKLNNRQWVPIEQLCSLPGGMVIMEPHTRLAELRAKGYMVETRRRTRRWPSGYTYSASDVALRNDTRRVRRELEQWVAQARDHGRPSDTGFYTVYVPNALGSTASAVQLRIPLDWGVVYDTTLEPYEAAALLWERYMELGTYAQRVLLGVA